MFERERLKSLLHFQKLFKDLLTVDEAVLGTYCREKVKIKLEQIEKQIEKIQEENLVIC